jgi:endonuclease/exonuclease/phosphatase family metal-dependent hydrolase
MPAEDYPSILIVLLVDIDGDPLRSRAPAFEPLAKMIRAYSQANLIVMGDFNTPLESVLFDSFCQYLTHAFESGGHGFAKTWPIPLPVLAIDHIWVSKKIKVASCKLNWSRLSDHRSVVANIEPLLRNAR